MDDQLIEIEEQTAEKRGNRFSAASIVLAALILAFAWVYIVGLKTNQFQKATGNIKSAGEQSENDVSQAVELPVAWGNLGAQMVAAGVIDRLQLEALYNRRGGLTGDEKQFLEEGNGKMIVTQENSGFILNLFWALGLSNKNEILEQGPMADPRYGGDASQFASTGGWTLAQGNTMDHYSRHSFVTLTPEQQSIVERVSRNIYRSCCDNSTYFPDCNHGMAMLGLLELLASQGASENQMFETALQMNSFWFPEQYATIALYLESQGQTFQTADPKEILGKEYSSASGFARIAALVPQGKRQGGDGCGI